MNPVPWIRNSGQRIRKIRISDPEHRNFEGCVVPPVVLDRLSLFTFSYFGRLARSPIRSYMISKCVRGWKSGTPTWPAIWTNCSLHVTCTVREMDLIERMLQTQLSMARRFKLQVLRRYNAKFSKMHNFTLNTLRLDKLRQQAGGKQTSLGSTAQDSTTGPPVHM